MEITGNLYCGMVMSAANFLGKNKEKINNLNVFPVPDGDTGINMSLTMSTLYKVEKDLPLGEAAQRVAGLMLRSARGNSGAILSLFFRGIAKALKGAVIGENRHIVLALEKGTEEAYRAVMNPTEGTMLTVMRVCAESARKAYDKNPDIGGTALFKIIEESASEALESTPELLPVLKQAGVVDAGGFGFLCVIKGMRAAYIGNPVEAPVQTEETDISENTGGASFSDFNTEDIKFAYCTECIIDKSDKYIGEDTAKELYEFITGIGDSAVFADDESIIKLHVHTNDPGAVLSKAIEFGSLASVKIENMKNQHTALAGGVDKPESKKNVKIDKKYGFVSVCMGEGIGAMFRDIGVDTVIEGGQTMNPSTQEIIDAVMRTPSEYVFILPNNKNIKMVAMQASELISERKAIVIPTDTVPQGISAMIAYNPDSQADEIEHEMKAAAEQVTSMSVTYAVRDTQIDRFSIKKGQFLGLVENKIACVSDSAEGCVKQLSRGMTGASYVTVFYGENINEEQASGAGAIISEKIGGGCEVAVLFGGQPVYSYIISVE